VIYQDSTSVIALVTRGGGVVRTKHLRVRMNLCKEALNLKRFIVCHIGTARMIADGFTKALEKRDFRPFMNNLLNGLVK